MKEWLNNPKSLVDLLTNYNSSLQAHNYVDKSERIFNALNIASNEYYQYRKRRWNYKYKGDKREFINLVKSLNCEEKKALLVNGHLKNSIFGHKKTSNFGHEKPAVIQNLSLAITVEELPRRQWSVAERLLGNSHSLSPVKLTCSYCYLSSWLY